MFSVGNLLYFNPFKFKNGNSPKPKFFVVLGVVEEEVVLASLPTSKDHVPAKYEGLTGCINDDAQQFNVFKFQAGIPVTDRNFSFLKDTYIYGEQLDTFPICVFQEQQEREEICIEVKGRLHDDVFGRLRDCLKNSAKVKRKYKRCL